MYAVVTSGGKQYRVEQGTTLLVERLTADPGTAVTFDRVLLVGDGDRVTVGTPVVEGATVSGTVLGEERGPKLVIYKFRQKVKYRRRTGHRQQLTRVRIDVISADGAAQGTEGAATPAAATPVATPKARRRPRAVEAAEPAEAAEAADKAPKPARRRASVAKKSAEEPMQSASGSEEKPASVKRAARTRKVAEE